MGKNKKNGDWGWTEEEINRLKEMAKSKNDGEIAKIMGRTKECVKKKRQRLNIKKAGNRYGSKVVGW